MLHRTRLPLLCLLSLIGAGCAERALEIPLDGDVHRDLSFSTLPDLSVRDMRPPRDLALPPDLASTDLPPPDPCPFGTQFIFTIDSDTTLSRFNPVTSQFFDVGKLSCPTKLGGTPNSMAIDRDGNGWINYSSGELFRLISATADCTGTPYTPGQGGLTSFGMSFAQDTPGSSDETLWITDSQNALGNQSLASVDLTTLKLATQINLIGGAQPELTGDDEANLWGFFPSSTPPRISRIDKKLGTLDRTRLLPSLQGSPEAWGVAAFRGDFFVFLQRSGESSTKVHKVNGMTGMVTTVVPNTGRRIVGVGVATCAGNAP